MIREPDLLGNLFQIYDQKHNLLRKLFITQGEEIRYMIIKFLNSQKRGVDSAANPSSSTSAN